MEIEQSLKEDIGTLEVLFRLVKTEIYLNERADNKENGFRKLAEEFDEPVISINHRLSNYFRITNQPIVVKSAERYKTNARILEISMQLLREPIEIVCMNLLLSMIMLEEAYCTELQEYDNKINNKSEPIVKLYTSRNGYYKKKTYQEKCMKYGIECTEDDKKGYINEKPSEQFIKELEKLNVNNYKFICNLIEKPRVQQRFIVYQCPECKIKVRGTKQRLHLMCNDIDSHPSHQSAIMREYSSDKTYTEK